MFSSFSDLFVHFVAVIVTIFAGRYCFFLFFFLLLMLLLLICKGICSKILFGIAGDDQ